MDVMRDLGHKWLLPSEFLGVAAMHWALHCLCARWRFHEMNCQDP
jgi:hypothetical protein